MDLLHREQGPGSVRLGHKLIVALEVPAGGAICNLPMPALRFGARTREVGGRGSQADTQGSFALRDQAGSTDQNAGFGTTGRADMATTRPSEEAKLPISRFLSVIETTPRHPLNSALAASV